MVKYIGKKKEKKRESPLCYPSNMVLDYLVTIITMAIM